MSFGSGGFGSGFGQTNNQQSGFGGGGFGSQNNTNTGFGATNNTGFGSNNTAGGGLFGGGSTSGFGSSGGFGTPQNNAFGAKPSGFGTTTTTSGGSLFGSGTATAGSGFGGGFGSSTPAAQSSPFGASNTGGGLFGQNKTGFAANTTTPSNPFGGASTSSPFGSNTGAFGAPASSALAPSTGECQGTGSVPFQATVEKEPNSNTNQQNAFQSITFQAPYQKFSPEELRLADYTQGRKHGNASNQAGAFGSSTGFGFGSNNQTTNTGFGAANTGTTSNMFGGGASSSPFGTSQPATSGFGVNTATSGGLFGAKPATTNLFGAPAQTQPSTGLFGSTGTTGFGSTNSGFGTNNAATGTSPFGASNTANKPAFSFTPSNPTTSAGTGFGNTPAATGFSGGGLFGTNNPQPNTTNAFGTPQQQPATNSLFGSGGGFGTGQQNTGTSSLFNNNNQQKPATGLFGAAPAATGTGGLFGGTQPAANTNAFGGANNTQNTGGLFGAPKPATTGLFSQPNNQQNTGGSGLFGSGFGSQTQGQNQPQTNSLFGGLNNANNQSKPSLFASTQQNSGSNLFGATNTQQPGNSFFGASLGNNQQQQQQPQINSLFGGGNSLIGSQQQQPQGFTASLSDATAFGGGSLFASLNGPPVRDPGPLATPLSNSVTKRKTAALPMYKLQPTSSSRFSTPARRGFGFSYSNYNSPGSASSAASTPGGNLNSSLLGGTFGRGLSKSMSTSSLRRSFNTEDSILAPGAFSASPSARHYGSTGSMKKLVINRGIRNDLFTVPTPSQAPSTPNGSILKKRVSFDASSMPGANTNGTSSPLKQTQNSLTPSSTDLGYERPRPNTNGSTASPEMEQVKGNELALARVQEEESPAPAGPPNPPPKPIPGHDMDPGQYWMSPSKADIENMNRVQRQKVTNFKVGREGIGHVGFDVPVDLTGINLDELFGKTIILTTRSVTVYPDSAKKPPMGKGLNVPSTIELANSWPRKKAHNSENIAKHVSNLKRVENTKFVNYDPESGIWIFKVDHFTTYKFYDDEEETDGDDVSQFGQSTLSAPPDTPTPKNRTPRSQQFDHSFESEVTQTESDPDDTFQFRKKKTLPLPGAFDDQDVYADEEIADESDEQDQQSFLDERSVGSQSENGVEEPTDQDDVFEDDESVSIVDQEMAGSFPQADNTAELEEDDSQDGNGMEMALDTPGAIVRARLRAAKNSGTPTKSKFATANDWTSTLKTTISPQKQDRALLKSLLDIHDNDSKPAAEPTPVAPRNRVVSDGRGFATSIDLMNSLFGQTRSPVKAKIPAKAKGFEWPYAKRSKTNDNDTSDMTGLDRAFHDSMKPSWGPDGTLVYAAPSNTRPFSRSSRRSRERDGVITIQKGGVVSESRDVRFAKFSNEASAEALKKHQAMTTIDASDDVPYAQLPEQFSFSDFFDDQNARNPAAAHEKLIWQLASVLFDEIVVPDELKQVANAADRLRKDKLSDFWQKLVDHAFTQQVSMARSNEEKAIAALSGHRVSDACGHLLNGKDFHLATLVALIGKDSNKKNIREQLNEWQKQRVLSEFSQPIRAIYEILAGNVCVCDGSKGAPIEDRINSFIISQRFGLDWRQAFGLRLWYGILATEELGAAVEKFAHDLSQDLETSKPQAWYVEQKIPTLWEDKGLDKREDLLWGLLRLYTFSDCDLEAIIRPENSQLSPVDIRLSWQLSRALTSSGVVKYNEDGDAKADQITLSFASQLTSEGSWLDAVFVLLHLSSDEARAKSIQDHLAQHAGSIGSDDSQNFTTLTQTYKIPAPWVWEAKALYLRSVKKDPTGEVKCLLQAGSFEEAHRTFSKEVAPKTIIECDYDTLRTLLSGFHGREEHISEWHVGGEIYSDILQLLDSQKKAKSVDYALLNRLLAGLPKVVEESRNPGFMETVAIETISGVVAKTVVDMGKNGEKHDLPKVLRLPLTEDTYLKHTVDLSLGYYRDVMAGGR